MEKKPTQNDIDFSNQPKMYTYEECVRLSNYYYYTNNFVWAKYWLDMANELLENKSEKVTH